MLCPYQHSQFSDGVSAATADPQGTAWNVVAKSAAGLGVGASFTNNMDPRRTHSSGGGMLAK